MLSSLLSGLGLAFGSAACLTLIYKTIQFIDLYLLAPNHPLQNYKVNRAKANEQGWALITGSSGGIGYGYARYLLSQGFGVILLAHTGIPEAESKLKKEYPHAAIRSYTMNCTRATVTEIKDLVHRISQLPVTVLINNVGGMPMSMPIFRPFKDYGPDDIDNHIKMNAAFATHLTQAMMPSLIKNASPKSLILNISSGSRIGHPYFSIYSATKGYITSLSHSLARECRHFGYPVDVLCIFPGDVLSDINRLAMQKGAPLANDYARCVLERVDKAVKRGLFDITPYWRHVFQWEWLEWLPEGYVARELIGIAEAKRDALAKFLSKEE